MESIIPINGRIAIIDDVEKEIAPLMRALSSHSLPFIYIKPSDERYFPVETGNDIRVLFLDLNLLGSQATSNKQVKSILAGVLRRVISKNNFPYLIVLWSKQEKEYIEVLNELFDNELNDIAPIGIESFIKSDFFPVIDGDEAEADKDILDELLKALKKNNTYSYLLSWENLIHESADVVLDEVFNNSFSKNNWSQNTGVVFDSMGRSFAGKHYDEGADEEKIKWAFSVFNRLFDDTVETNLWQRKIDVGGGIAVDKPAEQPLGLKSFLNSKLLITFVHNDICEPGSVLQFQPEDDSFFRALLNGLLSLIKIKGLLKCETPDILDGVLKKQAQKQMTEIKKEIQGSWEKVGVIVTPNCDYAQKKKVFDRVLLGVLIDASFKNYLNDTGPSFFVSPEFHFRARNYVLALDFKYLTAAEVKSGLGLTEKDFLFKIRKQVLAEVQSLLSHHINRQGLLNLE